MGDLLEATVTKIRITLTPKRFLDRELARALEDLKKWSGPRTVPIGERGCAFASSGSSALNQPVKLANTERFRRAYSEVLGEPHGDDDGP